jgi:hypothetical protein
MAFVKGQVANPKGRPKGSKNKKDEMIAKLTQQAIDGGLLPLDFFLSNLRNDEMPLGFRYENAKAAAPYCHRKMPIAIENADAPFKVFDMSMLVGLSDAELAVVEKLMSKAQEQSLAEHKREERQPLGPKAAPTVDKPSRKPAPKPKQKRSWES